MLLEGPIPMHTVACANSDDVTPFEGYVAVPQMKGVKRPSVVLTHDWSDLNAPVKRLAERYAGLGSLQ